MDAPGNAPSPVRTVTFDAGRYALAAAVRVGAIVRLVLDNIVGVGVVFVHLVFVLN
jgi:hypothetical protein